LKELTIEESVKLHRELWGWLADNPEMSKGDWSGWEDLACLGMLCVLRNEGQLRQLYS